jgi:hypothetical protein
MFHVNSIPQNQPDFLLLDPNRVATPSAKLLQHNAICVSGRVAASGLAKCWKAWLHQRNTATQVTCTTKLTRPFVTVGGTFQDQLRESIGTDDMLLHELALFQSALQNSFAAELDPPHLPADGSCFVLRSKSESPQVKTGSIRIVPRSIQEFPGARAHMALHAHFERIGLKERGANAILEPTYNTPMERILEPGVFLPFHLPERPSVRNCFRIDATIRSGQCDCTFFLSDRSTHLKPGVQLWQCMEWDYGKLYSVEHHIAEILEIRR